MLLNTVCFLCLDVVCCVVDFVVSMMHVVGGVPLPFSVCGASNCYSECGALCYL